MDKLNLLPCAHCGSADVRFASPGGDDEKSYDYVICNGCGMSAARADCDGDPRETWNRRAAPSSSSEELPEPLDKLLDELAAQVSFIAHGEGGAPFRLAYARNTVELVKMIRSAIAADRRARQGEPVAWACSLDLAFKPMEKPDVEWGAECTWHPDYEPFPLYRAATKAAAPADAPTDPVVEANRQMLLDRSRAGIAKYGVTLAGAGLSHRQLTQHALEEALDLANYLQTILMTTHADAREQQPGTINPMCERKTAQIMERDGYAKSGYVLRKDGADICVSDGGAVAWFTPEQWGWLMFNRMHTTFDWPKPVTYDCRATGADKPQAGEDRDA